MTTKRCPYCAEEIQLEAVKCKHCGSWLGGESPAAGPTNMESLPGRLARSSQDRMFLGVCGGIGRHLGVDPTLIRILYALGTFFTAFFPGIICYFILALIMPPDEES